jgi:hypothetical protein
MFATSLTEEVRQIEEEIDAVKEKVDDPILCEKVRQFVYGPREIQQMYKADSGTLFTGRFTYSGLTSRFSSF